MPWCCVRRTVGARTLYLCSWGHGMAESSRLARLWYQSFANPIEQAPYIERLQASLDAAASPGPQSLPILGCKQCVLAFRSTLRSYHPATPTIKTAPVVPWGFRDSAGACAKFATTSCFNWCPWPDCLTQVSPKAWTVKRTSAASLIRKGFPAQCQSVGFGLWEEGA